MAEPLVDVTGLARSFAGGRGVSNVSMRLEAGGMIGLVGANGGGKTTTLRMLAGLLRPESGSGTVLGADVVAGRPQRAAIGYMAQGQALYTDLTLRENMRFRCAMFGLHDGARRIPACADRYGLSEMLDRRVGTLSGGWMRRAHFATSLLHGPRLLLLDEPTAGLDALTRQQLWTWLEELRAAGTGIVIATHDLHEAARIPLILHYRVSRAEGPLEPAALMAAAGAPSLEAAVIAMAGMP